jgi:hypothetical protein
MVASDLRAADQVIQATASDARAQERIGEPERSVASSSSA